MYNHFTPHSLTQPSGLKYEDATGFVKDDE